MLNRNPNVIFINVILSVIFACFYILDNALIFILKHKKVTMDNQYYAFHVTYGCKKITALKFFAALYIIYDLFQSTGKSGLPVTAIVAYVVFVIILLSDFIKDQKKKAKA